MKISALGIAIAAAALMQLTAYADTTDTISVNSTPAVGENFTVTVRIESDSDIGYLNSSLEYDDSVIEFTGGDAWGGGGLITLYSFPGEDSGVIDCVLNFTAIDEGDSALTLTNGYVFSTDGSVLEQPASSASVHVDAAVEDTPDTNDSADVPDDASTYENVPTDSTASESTDDTTNITEEPQVQQPVVQGYLIGLTCTAGELSPEFSYDTFEYIVNADSSCETAELNATAAAFSDMVTISGGGELDYGENIITATVTAEDGTVNTYTVKVIRSKGENGDKNDNSSRTGESTEDRYKKLLNPALAIILITLIVALFIVINWTMKLGKKKKK
ncbi:cadherin-like beta sandwich domain-containing protein [Ruminococcus albus]|uniref:Cadherin-like beta sandwich domain-containing protein n=1 Tax=Ruminococcus albus TaxID=1264 RepID=A0A1I1NXU2_RUMAL|nr:cadherin-like beta sandwich domain-containing protein [Ruminococcus albus]SFC99543.1 Cadherin-like beta sandwich domain-containing protein [Ruminococcus albus]